jgi:hypothetical protein
VRALAPIALLAVLAAPGAARAERRLNPLARDSPPGGAYILRLTDEGRWEAGAGVAGGWRPLVDLHLRYYVRDTVSAGTRLRIDRGGPVPRAIELELGKAIGRGKMLFPGDLLAGTRLVLQGGPGAVHVTDRYVPFAFGELALRVVPAPGNWLAFEVAVREAWAPSPAPASLARATTVRPPVEFAYGPVTELRASIAVLWPRPGRVCTWHRARH